MKNLSFSRQILPILAIAGIIVAAIIVFTTQPDRSRDDPEIQPPSVPSADGNWVAGSGVIEPASEIIEIGSALPGLVEAVLVQPGDRVERGQPLFRLDRRDAIAAVREAEARVASLRSAVAASQTQLATARRQLSLYQSVEDPRAIAEQEVITRRGTAEDAAAQLAVSRANLNEASANLERARVTLDRLTVRAPITGEILQVDVRPGQYATAGPAPGNAAEPLISMGETNPLHVRIDIDENEIERVRQGRAARISPRGDATRRVEARFVRAEPLVTPKRSLTNSSSERVDVRVLQLIYALPAGAKGFYVGQQVDAYVPAKAGKADTAKQGGE